MPLKRNNTPHHQIANGGHFRFPARLNHIRAGGLNDQRWPRNTLSCQNFIALIHRRLNISVIHIGADDIISIRRAGSRRQLAVRQLKCMAD